MMVSPLILKGQLPARGPIRRSGLPRWIGLTILAVSFFLIAPLINFAGPLPPAEDNTPDPARGARHYAQALMAAGKGDCPRLRLEAASALRDLYPIDPELVQDWGFRCGAPLEDGVSYKLGLLEVALAQSAPFAAAATVDGKVFLFDLADSCALPRWDPGLPDIADLDFADDGTRVAAGGGRRVAIHLVKENQTLAPLEFEDYVSAVRLSHRGDRIAVGLNRSQSGPEERPFLVGKIQVRSLDPAPTAAAMKSVPGNPVALAFTPDDQWLIAVCWPERYTYCTISWLCVFDARTGERKFCRELRTSSRYPARLSANGNLLAYPRLDPTVLAGHLKELDQEGRPYDTDNSAALAWLLDAQNYLLTARSVFSGNEVPLVGGREVLALDQNGKRAVLLSAGQLRLEEIGAGKWFGINLAGDPAAQKLKPCGGFGQSGSILVFGRTNGDLARFGWLPSEISPRERK